MKAIMFVRLLPVLLRFPPKGDRVTIERNGQLVVDHARMAGLRARGPIVRQSHSEGIGFRKVSIRELP